MAIKEIEARVAALEEKVAQLMQEREALKAAERPWWQQIVGAFENDPHFEEAMRLGREWRMSERAGDDEDEPLSDVQAGKSTAQVE